MTTAAPDRLSYDGRLAHVRAACCDESLVDPDEQAHNIVATIEARVELYQWLRTRLELRTFTLA